MKSLPQTDDPLLLRTSFADEAAWTELCAAIQAPSGEEQFRAYVTPISDRAYDGVSLEEVVSAATETGHSFLFLADAISLEGPEHALLVVDLHREPGRSFRTIPSEAWSVENNLSLANIDFSDFTNALDHRGIFRGF